MEDSFEARPGIRWLEKINKDMPALILPCNTDWRIVPTQSIHLVQVLDERKHPF